MAWPRCLLVRVWHQLVIRATQYHNSTAGLECVVRLKLNDLAVLTSSPSLYLGVPDSPDDQPLPKSRLDYWTGRKVSDPQSHMSVSVMFRVLELWLILCCLRPASTMTEEELQAHYDDFFEVRLCGRQVFRARTDCSRTLQQDVFWELEEKYGEIEQMNVCENQGDHLVGNVYVMFKDELDAEKAVKDLNNRWFGGRPISAELSPVTDFREACCRQYEQSECTRGGFCNFMHIKPVSKDTSNKIDGGCPSATTSARSYLPFAMQVALVGGAEVPPPIEGLAEEDIVAAVAAVVAVVIVVVVAAVAGTEGVTGEVTMTVIGTVTEVAVATEEVMVTEIGTAEVEAGVVMVVTGTSPSSASRLSHGAN